MATRGRPAGDSGLGADELAALVAAVADGKRPTVYLREPTPGLNLPAGASAKVLRVEGNTVTVKPAGVDDELPYEAEELRTTRRPPVVRQAARAPAERAPKQALPQEPPTAVAAPRPSSRKGPRAVSVTIHASADNEWTVAVTQGDRRPGKATPVTADAVERAVDQLGDPAAVAAVEAVLSSARLAAAEKVAELSRQLEDARNALAALGTPE